MSQQAPASEHASPEQASVTCDLDLPDRPTTPVQVTTTVRLMVLVLDAEAIEKLGKKGRGRIDALMKRVEYLNLKALEIAREGRMPGFAIAERSALRWTLWLLGLVVRDDADEVWSAEHPQRAQVMP